MERQAVRQTPWRTWKWIRYTGCIAWRDGISVVYGHAQPPHAGADAIRATEIVCEAGHRFLAARVTEDCSTWAMFVLGDRRDVKPLLAGMVDIRPRYPWEKQG